MRKNQEKKQRKINRGPLPASLASGGGGSVIPKLFIPCEAVAPTLNPSQEGSREGWWVVCAGWKPGRRGRGFKKEPRPSRGSADHQSRCWWRFRLRTERTSAVNLGQQETFSLRREAADQKVVGALLPQCIQHRQQVEKCRVTGVAEPGLDGYCVVWSGGHHTTRHTNTKTRASFFSTAPFEEATGASWRVAAWTPEALRPKQIGLVSAACYLADKGVSMPIKGVLFF